jgi:hypothetical protein
MKNQKCVGIHIMLMLAVLAVSLLFGCAATQYQPAKGSYAGGYTDLKIAPNMYRISFEGNAYISGEKAYQYTLYRAAEITKENNFSWFVIMDKDEILRSEYAEFLGFVEKPRNAIVIKLVNEGSSTGAYSADDIMKSINIQKD